MSQGLVHDIKLSSVGPAYATGPDLVYEPENLDLAMKLHYLRGIYYFGRQAFEGLSVLAIKEPMFTWLNKYPVTSGRFRRAESGRAYIKCNDCGVRFVEAKCEKTLDEWLEMKDASLEKILVPNQFIGPELGFSPLLFIQVISIIFFIISKLFLALFLILFEFSLFCHFCVDFCLMFKTINIMCVLR